MVVEKAISIFSHGLRARKLEQGLRFLKEGRPYEAFALFAELAQKGMPEAQYQVAQCYLRGQGTPSSLEEGAKWLYHAAQAGMVDACFSLGTLYAMGLPEGFDPSSTTSILKQDQSVADKKPDFDKALYWALKGAEKGDAQAKALVAHIYAHGPSTIKDAKLARYWYEKAAEAKTPQGLFGYGLILLREAQTPEEQKKAFTYLKSAADMDVGTANATIAWMYEGGIGTEKDLTQAAHYFARAAEHEIAPAQARYGLMLLKGIGVKQNLIQAETWLRRAAQNGHADSAALLGDLYIRGENFNTNATEAFHWYQMAAEMGHASAMRALGVFYLTGTGVEHDDLKAALWFNKAASLGNRQADADLGNLILAGVSLPPEEQTALRDRWQKRAETGDELSAFNFGVCLAQEVGGHLDEKQALYWMSKALNSVVNAQYWYGKMLFEGKGCEPDPVEGLKWLQKAADAGMADACVAVARLCITGYDYCPRDHKKALALYLKAAEKGSSEACFALGAMYGGGHDVPSDTAKALHYFKMAAQKGHVLAEAMLGRYLVYGIAGNLDREEGLKWLHKAADQGAEEAKKTLLELDNASGETASEKTSHE